MQKVFSSSGFLLFCRLLEIKRKLSYAKRIHINWFIKCQEWRKNKFYFAWMQHEFMNITRNISVSSQLEVNFFCLHQNHFSDYLLLAKKKKINKILLNSAVNKCLSGGVCTMHSELTKALNKLEEADYIKLCWVGQQ